jgi:hypothetical protein
MGKSAPSHTTQTTEVKLPAWVEEASKSNYDLAKLVSGRPLTQYQGPTVADQSNMTTRGYDLLNRNIGASDPLYEQAYRLQGRTEELDPIYARARGYQDRGAALDSQYAPAQQWAKQAATGFGGQYDEANALYRKAAGPFDPSSYMNPYRDEVERNAISNAERATTAQVMANADQARGAKAFGGSRDAITEGVLRAEGQRNIGDLSAKLRKEGYDTSVSNMFADREGMRSSAAGILSSTGQEQRGLLDSAGSLTSTLANRQRGLYDAASGLISGASTQGRGWLDAAAGINATAGARQDSLYKDIAGLLSSGMSEQGYRQSLIDADVSKFNEARNYPIEQLNMRLAALGMSPYGKTENTEKTGTAEKSGPDWATIGLGILKLIPGLSDKRDKTDIKKLGKDSKAGLPLYAYRYKGDPKSYPKVVGPMAQDVEKKYPELVNEVGGRKVVTALGLLSEV